MSSHISAKLGRVSCLHEHCAWSGELANQALTSAQIANDATTGDSFENVVAVPRDEVAVVDDILLLLSQLKNISLVILEERTAGQAELTSFLMMAPML